MNEDWRLLNYDSNLNNSIFEFRKFETVGSNDHEHCVLCWKKITDLKLQDEHDEMGYCCYNLHTQQTNWICQDCFNEFQKVFGWLVK